MKFEELVIYIIEKAKDADSSFGEGEGMHTCWLCDEIESLKKNLTRKNNSYILTKSSGFLPFSGFCFT